MKNKETVMNVSILNAPTASSIRTSSRPPFKTYPESDHFCFTMGFFSRGAVYLAKDRVTREKPVCEHVRGAYTWELSEIRIPRPRAGEQFAQGHKGLKRATVKPGGRWARSKPLGCAHLWCLHLWGHQPWILALSPPQLIPKALQTLLLSAYLSVFFSEIISLWSWEKEWMPEETPLYRMLRFLVLCCQPPRPLDAGDRVSILQIQQYFTHFLEVAVFQHNPKGVDLPFNFLDLLVGVAVFTAVLLMLAVGFIWLLTRTHIKKILWVRTWHHSLPIAPAFDVMALCRYLPFNPSQPKSHAKVPDGAQVLEIRSLKSISPGQNQGIKRAARGTSIYLPFPVFRAAFFGLWPLTHLQSSKD
ncbi:uncharacterized protein LOC105238736 isoform X2 [Ailuropoda melanoleuca]|uniref:uncharacterized protein LOC105238736 isoform X2 n=1 Tax=Ailuropoda melanoleuca TaxID=9646 RepID=UPI0014940CB8|nr:uncharacterized protein LOC105238736 isoform X2 [Ailuropoda melanoleuca]